LSAPSALMIEGTSHRQTTADGWGESTSELVTEPRETNDELHRDACESHATSICHSWPTYLATAAASRSPRRPPRLVAAAAARSSAAPTQRTQVQVGVPLFCSRASLPHRPREDGLEYPADSSRTNLASVLGLLARWRLSQKPLGVAWSCRETQGGAESGPSNSDFA
jgi:pimeloyl-ACP methyl ester carboxylesterase